MALLLVNGFFMNNVVGSYLLKIELNIFMLWLGIRHEHWDYSQSFEFENLREQMVPCKKYLLQTFPDSDTIFDFDTSNFFEQFFS